MDKLWIKSLTHYFNHYCFRYLDFLNKKKQERDAKIEAEAAAKKAAAEATTKTEGETSSASSPATPNERDTHPPEAAASKESSVSSVRRWFSGSKSNIPNAEGAVVDLNSNV